MAIAEPFRRQVALLLRAVPLIAEESCFALKGGTAINLFVRDLPRLSVDIDLTYVPVAPREASLEGIDNALRRIAARIATTMPLASVGLNVHEGAVTKLLVRERRVQIKIEVTPVMRGCAFRPELRAVTPTVEAEFGYAEMPVVSLADLYAGKLVAALDRQHPRDLFDVRELLAHGGLTPDIRTAFLVYLISHNRPMAEILGGRVKDISNEFEANFKGMTRDPVSLEELLAARASLVSELVGNMPLSHKRFLVSFESGNPEWDELQIADAGNLPAVQWRQQNLNSISAKKRAKLVADLNRALGLVEQATLPELTGTPKRRLRPRRSRQPG